MESAGKEIFKKLLKRDKHNYINFSILLIME